MRHRPRAPARHALCGALVRTVAAVRRARVALALAAVPVCAVSATGAITGRPADFILYDDPHEIGDWNNERKLDLVWANFNIVVSRLNDRVKGRILVVAHRVSDKDLSSYLLQEKGWKYLRLPLVAVKRRTYELGHEEWTREKGDVLRPEAYPPAEIQRLRRTQVAPPFALFYQQGLGSQAALKARPEHFQSFAPFQIPIGPVVLSVDPGHLGGPNASCSVICRRRRMLRTSISPARLAQTISSTTDAARNSVRISRRACLTVCSWRARTTA